MRSLVCAIASVIIAVGVCSIVDDVRRIRQVIELEALSRIAKETNDTVVQNKVNEILKEYGETNDLPQLRNFQRSIKEMLLPMRHNS